MAEPKPRKKDSAKDIEYIDAVRAAEARISQQEVLVRQLQMRLRQEREELRGRIASLRAAAAELPLFDG